SDSQGRQGPCLRCRTSKYTSAHARRPSSRGPNASVILCARVTLMVSFQKKFSLVNGLKLVIAQGLSQVPGCGLLGQTGQGGRHEEDHQVCLIQIHFIHPDLQLFRAFCKLLDGKTHNPIDETAVDEFQQGVNDLIDIAVINTATLVQGGSV
ncbi:hypothetical protein B0H14DRAFT_2842008, partial [Mycena olivaceomarginata]